MCLLQAAASATVFFQKLWIVLFEKSSIPEGTNQIYLKKVPYNILT